MSIPIVSTAPAVTAVATCEIVPPASAVLAPPAAPEVDQVTQQPVPLRFPWLSRLSQQLESASGQRPAFDPAPVLGDIVDRSA
jgi:hypothetical protein